MLGRSKQSFSFENDTSAIAFLTFAPTVELCLQKLSSGLIKFTILKAVYA